MSDAELVRIKEIVEQTFKMDFVSDDQRKAVFASMADQEGGGGKSKLGKAPTGEKRTIAGKKIDTGSAVNEAIDRTNLTKKDLEDAKTQLMKMGHRNPDEKIVRDYAYQKSFLENLQKITRSNTSGQIGKWNFTSAESIHKSFNSYLDRRIQGQHARWTERKRNY